MMMSLSLRLQHDPARWMSLPGQSFIAAAFIVAFNATPSSQLASTASVGSFRRCPFAPASSALNLNLYNYNDNASQFRSLRSLSGSTSSLALSKADPPSTRGSCAVRSTKPPAANHGRLQLLSFYRFIAISRPEDLRDSLFERLKSIDGLRGTVYVAEEGINAQFAAPLGEPLERLLRAFGAKSGSDGGCLPFDTFENNPPNMGSIVDGDTPTFDKLVVRTRDCILRDGMTFSEEDNERPLDWSDAGVEIDPSEWDEQLRRPNVQLLDCRNSYESDRGSFVSAEPVNTQTFSETWSVLDSRVESRTLDPSEPVYIFCTGGIRCVKVGAYLKQRLGFSDVRSLRHGIIGYERYASESSSTKDDADQDLRGKEPLWVGENFLFDKRRLAEEDKHSK